jgi:hypothetical protein
VISIIATGEREGGCEVRNLISGRKSGSRSDAASAHWRGNALRIDSGHYPGHVTTQEK